ncbi:MAG TPA: NAD+ synthase, partial [Thermoanaerobaculia bacterium]|nr:NAD+ synthase [Thermoanaerobaculia bacterium]
MPPDPSLKSRSLKSRPLTVAVSQIDTTIGDFEGNARKIIEGGRRAEAVGADLVLFPELAVCGYPPKDLLERRSFLDECERTTRRVAKASGKAVWIFGSVARNRARRGRSVFNVAVAARAGRVLAVYTKRLLPTYDVFDEGRYFEPGTRPLVIAVKGRRVGITICEDIWNDKTFWKRPLYRSDPIAELRRMRVDVHVNIAASPWSLGKEQLRERMMRQIARRTRIPLVSCNLVGGNDGLVFDGTSSAFDRAGRLIARGRAFEEDFWTLELPDGSGPKAEPLSEISRLRHALVLALADYASKCGFQSAVLGLSGGIDSAVTAALAVEALGKERVWGVAMPGPYSSEGSLRDARELARRLGIRLVEVSITDLLDAYRATLAPVLRETRLSSTEENLQARIRGAILMALSNQLGHLVLSTGNKSELAVGYCTLYGDMVGGYAVLSDIPKTSVYSLAREINRDGEKIPSSSISKEPSAELRPDQKDTDSLPPYSVLDPLIDALVDHSLPVALAARRAGAPVGLAREIVRRLDSNEYKRRQMPPGPKVTARAFGEGRRYPIAQKFRV